MWRLCGGGGGAGDVATIAATMSAAAAGRLTWVRARVGVRARARVERCPPRRRRRLPRQLGLACY